MKKRRFAIGGFSDIDEGRDTPDQALARKASMSPMAASDKAAGLASTKGQDVGLKRLFMGNIDAPGSEASNSFGAGKGMADREAAVEVARESGRTAPRFTPTASPLPIPDKPAVDLRNQPNEGSSNVGLASIRTAPSSTYRDEGPSPEVGPAKPKNRIVSKAELAKSGLTLRDFLNKERGLKRRPDTTDYEAALKSVAKGKATRESDMQIDSRKKGGSIKAYASGGAVSSRADGCAQRGKTRGMMR
jgi:hypothetical protein